MFWRREKGLAATQEAGKAAFPLEYGFLQPYSSAEGACSNPSSSLCLASQQPDPAQPLDVRCHGDVLLGQNGLILGQRGKNQRWDDTEGSSLGLGSALDQISELGWGAHPWGPYQGCFGAGGGAEGRTGGDGDGAGRSPVSPLQREGRGEEQHG